jgi:hypothetical protein
LARAQPACMSAPKATKSPVVRNMQRRAINRHRAASFTGVSSQVWHRARYTLPEDVQYP